MIIFGLLKKTQNTYYCILKKFKEWVRRRQAGWIGC